MSPARRIVVALVAGLAVGVLTSRMPTLAPLERALVPVGQLWLRALQMTIVPLVVALLVTGVSAAAPSGALGRQGRRVVLLFAGLLAAAGALAALLVPPLLGALPVPRAAGALAGGGAVSSPAAGDATWLDAILPANPIGAAADGAMLPLVVFVILFAVALTRVAPETRETAVGFFRAVADAMQVLVGWVIALAPLGVFATVVPMVRAVGGVAAGAVAYYLALNAAVLGLVTLLVYPLGARGAGGAGRFARAMLPAQAIAASTRSSVASLPVMLDAARALGIRAETAGFVLPLAVTLFRITTPPAAVLSLLFAARFEGIAVDAGTLALATAASVALSLGVVGVPGVASYFVTRIPMFAIAGVPLDILGALLAVDLLPDVFRTVGNVTADVAVTTLAESPARAGARVEDATAVAAGASSYAPAQPLGGEPVPR